MRHSRRKANAKIYHRRQKRKCSPLRSHSCIGKERAGSDAGKADPALACGNTKYTAGAMRFAYGDKGDLIPLLRDANEPRLSQSDFGNYSVEKVSQDLLGFNDR